MVPPGLGASFLSFPWVVAGALTVTLTLSFLLSFPFLAKKVSLARLQPCARGWRAQQELPGVQLPPTTTLAESTSIRAGVEFYSY